MLLILLSWILLTFVFLSFGYITVSIWNKVLKRKDKYSFFDLFWLGLIFLTLTIVFISLILPINIYVNMFALGIPITFWIFNYKKGFIFIKDLYSKLLELSLFTKASIIIVAIVMIAAGITNWVTYDSGLYYLQTLMWNEQYSVVPGLGNLHGRFGFNSVFLLLSTLFYHPSYFSPFFPINGLCMFIVIAWGIIQISKVCNLFQQIAILLISCVVSRFYFPMTSSLLTDILPNYIVIYLILNCILYPSNFRSRGLILCALSFFCITLKLSFIPLITIPLTFLILYIKDKQYKYVWILMSSGALIIIPWSIRFVILTGYLIYPFPTLDIFSFDWKMPHELVELEKTVVYTWAIAPAIPIDTVQNSSFIDLVTTWFADRRLSEKGVCLLTLFSPIIILLSFKKWKGNHLIMLLWAISFSGALFNFIFGPDLRFSYGLLVLSAFLPFCYYKASIKRLSVALCLIISLFFISQLSAMISRKHINISTASIFSPNTLEEQYKTSDYYEYTIDGVIIYSTNPIGEDPRICYVKCSKQCFEQNLPCTPYLNKNLRLRGKSLQNGFKIE